MKLKILIVFILFNILIPIKSSGEMITNGKFEHISIDNGLSNEHVTSIFQDSKGYIWIGTEDGLNRYDGENIKIYNCDISNENTLSSTHITDIEEDSNGSIWIGTDNGLDFLVTDTDKVVRMKDRVDSLNLGNLKITSLLKSSYDENIMWIGTENGLFRCDVKKGTIKSFYHDLGDDNSLSNSSITCLEEYENGELWVGTKRGINLIDKDFNIEYRNIQLSESKSFISSISKDNYNNIWISTKEEIFVYDMKDEEREYIYQITNDSINKYKLDGKIKTDTYSLEDNGIKFYNNFLFNDSKNNTWISSSNGAIKYSKDKNTFDIYKKNINSKNSITSEVITCFYEDSNGTIWIGTDKGANILNDNTIFNFTEKTDENIVSILKHNDQLWVATKFNGIYIYDIESGELVNEISPKENSNLSDVYIKTLFCIGSDYIVIVTNKEYIIYDVSNNSYTKMLIGDGYSSEINYMYSDGEDVWIASTTDFYSYNFDTKKNTYYSQDMNELGINPGRIRYILQDYKDENIIWVGGVDTGVIKYHKQKGVIKRYTNNPTNKNSLISNYINCMTFDDSGNLWIGTNIGLSKFDIEKNKFTSYTAAEGLTNHFINSIVIDNNSDIWISTNKGLNKFDREKNHFTNFTNMDGLYGYQFNLNSSAKLDDGTILFGSTEGYTYFNPDNLTKHEVYSNELAMGDIYVGKDKVIYDGNELVLEYNHKDLNISYFLPNYENLNNITYEYMLEGIDLDWIYIDSRNNLEFKSLEPGKYTLIVRARDVHGELTKEMVMNIRVKNPIWRTPLAYIIYISIILILGIYLFNYVNILRHLVNQKTMKLNNQLEENKRLSQEIIDKEKLKNNYFVNLSHELRTPINVIASTVQLLNLLSKNKNITQEKFNQYMNIIGKSCDNLLKIINDIIDTSKIETGKYKINKKNNDIVYIVEEAALNMSKFIEDKGLSLIIDPNMEEKIISCDETEIERCVINLLGNAVKFTDEGGEIRVYIKEIENNIEITVEDTGIGISKEDQQFIFKRFSQVEGTGVTKVSSSGIGLTLVKYITELHGGYIKLESELNKGSKFTIGIPAIVENISGESER